jgi:hypothetical protein
MIAAITATHTVPINQYVIKSIAKNICRYSISKKMDPYIVLGIIRHESGFNPRAKSKTDDHGLMQINRIWHHSRCNIYKIRCNIRTGIKVLVYARKACKKHKLAGYHLHTHWLRHYNWYDKNHHLRVLWLAAAYKKASTGHTYLYKIIKDRRKYKRVTRKVSYSCIKENLCGAIKNM